MAQKYIDILKKALNDLAQNPNVLKAKDRIQDMIKNVNAESIKNFLTKAKTSITDFANQSKKKIEEGQKSPKEASPPAFKLDSIKKGLEDLAQKAKKGGENLAKKSKKGGDSKNIVNAEIKADQISSVPTEATQQPKKK